MQKSKLKVDPHHLLADDQVVEVWHEDELVATVYGADGPGVRIISKYPMDIVRGGLRAGDTIGMIEIRIEK